MLGAISIGRGRRFGRIITVGCGLGLAAVVAIAAPVSAVTSISGPLNLGAATSFAALGSTTVTNTGSSVLTGDVGLSPGTSVTGFPPGVINGVQHIADATAIQAQSDLTTAYNVAASLTPQASGLTQLGGQTLTPGVYSGGALSLNGVLTLSGSASSVWVFQASSTLTTATSSSIVLTGGASACNVFWQVGSSATIAPASTFVGSVLANASITAQTAAVVTGRLLARTGALTLDTNTVSAPTGCANASSTTVGVSPVITSGAPTSAVAGTAYSFAVTASGSPTVTYAIVSGALPTGLTLNGVTGVISGTPTVAGRYTFSVSASNGIGTPVSSSYSIIVGAQLALTGTNDLPLLGFSAAFIVLGTVLLLAVRRGSWRRTAR